jgi:hypothetical protein
MSCKAPELSGQHGDYHIMYGKIIRDGGFVLSHGSLFLGLLSTGIARVPFAVLIHPLDLSQHSFNDWTQLVGALLPGCDQVIHINLSQTIWYGHIGYTGKTEHLHTQIVSQGYFWHRRPAYNISPQPA